MTTFATQDIIYETNVERPRYCERRSTGLGLEGYESAIGWQSPEEKEFRKLLADYRKKNPAIHPGDNMLHVQPANEWLVYAQVEPVSEPLFGDLWKEGELAIMFADTGTGKSILATQIAESLARGKNYPFTHETDAYSIQRAITPEDVTLASQKVLYLDFELSAVQFMERYSRSSENGLRTGAYEFSPNLFRSEIKWDNDLPEAFRTFGDFMAYSISQRLNETESKILIVDNISYLATANTNANSALALMKGLKAIKADFGISILVLAHTPKRPITKPLTVNDLAGSKMLANFADNLFAIGKSIRGRDLRYIKHIKQRNCPAIYDASNVIVCRLEKPDNFPQFKFVEFDDEAHHTTRPYESTNAERTKLITAAKELAAEGMTQRDIAEQLQIGLGTVNRYLSEVAEARTQ